MTELPRIYVDFSNQDEDNLVFARAARASNVVHVGDLVLALNREGNECLGHVARIADGIVFLDLDWSTWLDEDAPRTSSAFPDVLDLQSSPAANGNSVADSESKPPRIPLEIISS